MEVAMIGLPLDLAQEFLTLRPGTERLSYLAANPETTRRLLASLAEADWVCPPKGISLPLSAPAT